MLTRDEIFDILKRKHKIDITVRTFDYYRDKGLIPPIQGRRNRKGLYPNNTPDVVASIKRHQSEGMSLSKIKKLKSTMHEKRLIEDNISENRTKLSYIKGWSDPKERKRRLIDFLNLEDLGQRYDVGMIGKSDDCTFTFIAVFFDEFIDFYKIQINYKKPGENKILDEKRLTPDGYEWIARSITHSKLGIGKLIDKNDIFINLFWQ